MKRTRDCLKWKKMTASQLLKREPWVTLPKDAKICHISPLCFISCHITLALARQTCGLCQRPSLTSKAWAKIAIRCYKAFLGGLAKDRYGTCILYTGIWDGCGPFVSGRTSEAKSCCWDTAAQFPQGYRDLVVMLVASSGYCWEPSYPMENNSALSLVLCCAFIHHLRLPCCTMHFCTFIFYDTLNMPNTVYVHPVPFFGLRFARRPSVLRTRHSQAQTAQTTQQQSNKVKNSSASSPAQFNESRPTYESSSISSHSSA